MRIKSYIKRLLFFSLIFLIPVSLISQTFGKRFQSEVEKQNVEEQMKGSTTIYQNFVLEQAIYPDKYILGPGDILAISINTDQVYTFEIIISPTEDILIPGVGLIDLHGVSLSDARKKIIDYIHENAYQNARIGVVLATIREFKVQVYGAVNRPGFYDINPVMRVNEVIELAGGFHQLARESDIQVKHNDNSVTSVNGMNYILNGDLNSNPTLKEGDRLFVPFANLKEEGIVIRGSLYGTGYDIIENNETLGSFLRRRVKFKDNTDLESVTITRLIGNVEKYIMVFPENFESTILKAGDQIDILTERGVSVIGFVQKPGGYYFFPGYTVTDYISLAGGNTIEGNASKVIIKHLDGTKEEGQYTLIRRGDVISVPRTQKNILFGDQSILQIVVSVASIVLTFIAATK